MAISTINLQPSTWEYGVFLSFRGEDSFKNFTGHLYSALCNASIRTFIDEEELRKGESLAPELTRAIQNSRVSMIVFSKNYASSRWCLDELLQILQCREKGKQLVYPIFYDVEPSEVRNQSGNYGIALAKHEERFGRSDKIQNWRDALTKVANISGWDLQGPMNGYESKLIDEIVQDVLRIVSPRIMPVAKHVVGLESRVDDVLQFNYGTNNNDVRMIGIYGMGGIGKSTLAKALYNKLLGYFERSYFLEISSEILETKKLQEELLSKLLNKRKIEVGSEGEGKMLIKYWLQAKKCLIVLDNLEHRNQFEALCGERDWFGKGSTLILTTRDAHVLKELNKGECYEAKTLVHEESLQLFRLHAFREPTLPKEDYAEVLDRILAYCEGLPLALEVLGSYLSGRSMEEWISAFEKLRKIPHNDVQAKLKISYEGLPDDHTKSLFLDLVCFYGEISEETFNAMGYFSTIEIRNLVDKCLISPWYYSMHSLIREMGREIIRSESPNKPGERSRLWCPSDIHDVLIQQKGTEKIEMIVLNSPMKNMEYKYNTKAFKDMKNLRFLQIDGIHLEGNFKHLPRNVLRFLRWNQCPLKYIPSAYSFERLVKLEMWESNIKEFGVPLKVLKASTLNFPIEFEGNLSNNETLSWIKFEENGSSSSSSISFQWSPLISNLEFLGICIWVVVLVLEPFPTDCYIHYNSRIEKDGFRVWYRSRDSIRLSGVQLLKEGGNVVSFVDFIPRDCFKDIKAGEIFKVISNVEEVIPKFKYVQVGMVKKIRVEALYRDREDGFLQFLPFTKLDSNTTEEGGGGEKDF
ncbi:TMV resistance protein N-like isoform X3 [Ipomoea triloba]|uniref:TMV resistance protein N-like isoform X3 n=1 Tax=Ipomoea triloba TaxID=35885 RepID=UPI00125D3D24|nr:TMV resistance protein N-like isoform X3 [Ipomoea triloba]